METPISLEKKRPLTVRYEALLKLEPKLVTAYVPKNAAEQKAAFLRGEVRNPEHEYDRVDAIDFAQRNDELAQAGEQLLAAPEMNPKFTGVYESFVDDYKKKTQLLELARAYNHAVDGDEKAKLREDYMRLNIELYGAPDEATYQSLLQEKLAAIAGKQLTGEAAALRDELFAMTDYQPGSEIPERFKPSAETMKWMGEVVDGLYGNMLARVPEGKESFDAQETKEIFDAIITEEFGDAAAGWQVDVEEAKAINVKSTEKRIVIPAGRTGISADTLKGLVVHEIGVHMFRAVTGGETDLEPLANGLNDYYDAEEGLGVVMEQARKGVFREAGVDHYITAGLAYSGQKDFRDTYEVKWRLGLLEKLSDNQEVAEADRSKAQNTAYGGTMRMFRGTDELPWFKDLAYYNGAVMTWRHLEEIRGDDLRFTFVLLGKNDPSSKAHERIVYETSSK